MRAPNLGLALAAGKLATTLQQQATILQELAQAANAGDWNAIIACSARWARNEEVCRYFAQEMEDAFSTTPTEDVQCSLRSEGKTLTGVVEESFKRNAAGS